jgi:hypothetical protein
MTMIMPVISQLINFYSAVKVFSGRLIFFPVLIMLVCVSLPGRLHSQTPSIVLDSVSVNTDNTVIIGWTLTTVIEDGYVEVHRRLDNGLYALITKVPMPGSYFIDTGVNAQNKAFSYYVVAYDATGNVIGNTAYVAHQTVFLSDLEKDICGRMININWSNYALTTTVGQPVPVPSPFLQGEVLVSYNNSTFQPISAIDGIIEETSISATESGEYCVLIRAIDSVNNITSTSNSKCTTIGFPSVHELIYISNVTADETSSAAQISIYAGNPPSQPAYVLKKFSSVDNDFMVIDTIVNNQSTIEYTDPDALINEQSEIYQVEALDSCRHITLISQNVASIFLTVQSITTSVNQLDWNEYNGWSAGVQEYIVQRKINDFSDFENVASLPGSLTTFNDDLFSLDPSLLQGDIFYRILAVENSGNPYGFKELSLSNIAMANREIEIFIPNAFNPGSDIEANRRFKPVFTAYYPPRYSMGIYNRWTERIFYTEDISEAWDGSSYSGSAPAGVYSYVITYHDNQGNQIEKRGTLLLIR